MLQSVSITSEASYSTAEQRLSCKRINFIFGTNGSGKTTISRIIAAPLSHPTCSIAWVNNHPLECLVYNSDFITHNFVSNIPGIFTLGEESADTLMRIKEKKEQQDGLEKAIQTLRANLEGEDGNGGKLDELKKLRASFEETCWDSIKKKHDEQFQNVFEGLRNSKIKFCDKILAELASNTAKLSILDDLQARARTVFQQGLALQSPLALPTVIDLLAVESDPILAKKVVGKEDVDVAALIKRLGNSDWVKEGRSYLPQSGNQCPFCQQTLLNDLEKNLNEYFDELYIQDIGAINHLQDAYAISAEAVITRLNEIIASQSEFLDNAALQGEVDLLIQRIALNKQHLERKKREPSTIITLEALSEYTAAIIARLIAANEAVKRHNELVENLATARAALTTEVWKFLLEESKAAIDAYIKAKGDLNKAVAGLTAGIDAENQELVGVKHQIVALERSITSVEPTVNEINAILTQFGFTNFMLTSIGEKKHLYQIIRSDGSDATRTLSEGEKSFITFLYFYHGIRGSISESGMTTDRIIVFDDPVSSLDSDILFIVSTLIKRVLEEARNNTGQIKQVFVLTHNIYFHKEVSFDPNRGKKCRHDETFWIVRKESNGSVLVSYDHNPIKTSYELLWSEVRNWSAANAPNRSPLTIQNTLRRILEHYFRILGNLENDKIVAMFSGKEQQICSSLFSWVNDGSHSAHDDLYISHNDTTIASYLSVFRKIFEKTRHEQHYSMMMGGEPTVESPPDNPGGLNKIAVPVTD